MNAALKTHLIENVLGPYEGNGLVPAEERPLFFRLLRQWGRYLRSRGIQPSPSVAMRLEDVFVSYFIARRAEDPLRQVGLLPDVDDKGRGVTNKLDASNKARDRLRKAIKDLEDACPDAAASTGADLAAVLKPLIKKADAVLAEVFDQETQRAGSG